MRFHQADVSEKAKNAMNSRYYDSTMQHLMEQMGMNGGLEEILGGMGIGGGMDFNMTDIIQEWEAPFDVYCDCIPTDEEHGTLKVPY